MLDLAATLSAIINHLQKHRLVERISIALLEALLKKRANANVREKAANKKTKRAGGSERSAAIADGRSPCDFRTKNATAITDHCPQAVLRYPFPFRCWIFIRSVQF